MEDFVRRFIRASMVWLGVGVLIGSSMAFWPAVAMQYRPAHMHANLLGFVSMMIFGVAYHVMPRFSGNPLHSRALARAHFVVANVGLGLMVGGWVLRAHAIPAGIWSVQAGAAASTVGAFLFIANLWRTLGSVPRPARSAPAGFPASVGRPAAHAAPPG